MYKLDRDMCKLDRDRNQWINCKNLSKTNGEKGWSKTVC